MAHSVELDKGDVKKLYTVAERVGEGNYGAVFRAVSKKTGTVVAYKLISDIAKDELSEVLREVAILRRLSHQNIIQLLGAYRREKSEIVIITDFCAGGSLLDLCLRINRPVPEPILKTLMRDTLRGLVYLHESAFIHRDIKAENILLTEAGVVKLTDFGVSAQLTSANDRRRTFIGTPHWMAPEVILVNVLFMPYDCKVDIWSLGITCIELAEMHPPRYNLDGTQVLIEVPRKPPPTLAQPSQWSADMSNFLERALQRDPAQRSTASALLSHKWLADAGGVDQVAKYLEYTINPTTPVNLPQQRVQRASTVTAVARRETRKILWTHAQYSKAEAIKAGAKPVETFIGTQYILANEETTNVENTSPRGPSVLAAPSSPRAPRPGGSHRSTGVSIGGARNPSPLPTALPARSPSPQSSIPSAAAAAAPPGALLPRPRLPPPNP